ncbi:MAG TPA: glutamate-1-semialdehyde 2,1-aminomutase [Pseudobdellovibrionaceae bacterium]|nr:glutamate-1-semialdehyde 2,1-aminomutase [Pseudobdellovibrionaceae bacterium]
MTTTLENAAARELSAKAQISRGHDQVNSSDLFARALKVSPGGVHSPVRAFKSVGGQPMFFKSAQGAHLVSVEGRSYIDFCQSFGPLLLGHRDPEVTEVVRETLDLAWTFGACEPYSLELAEWIVDRVPHVEKLRFVSSGTEAVMSALRVARAATGRSRVLKFDGCYHGHVDSLLMKAGSGLADGQAATDSAGVSPQLAQETLIAPLDDLDRVAEILRAQASNLAAVIIEPLPANYGLLIQRREFLKGLESLCRELGILLIFDEVISGFRVARGGMAELLDVRPDLVTYGKVIGGGFPVGAYGGRADLMDLVAPSGPVYQAGTLSANPVGMRAGLATLKKAESLGIWSALAERTSGWIKRLNPALQERGWQIDHFGSIFWLRGRSDQPIRRLSQLPAGHAEKFRGVFHAAIERGVYLAPSGFEVGFVGWAHTPEILDEASRALVDAVNR